MKVTVTLKDVLKASKAELETIQMSAKSAFYLSANIRKLTEYTETYERAYRQLLDRFSEPGEKAGERIVPPDKVEEFTNEMSELLNTPVEIDLTIIPITAFPDNVPYGVIDKLHFMIDGSNNDNLSDQKALGN